MIKNKKIVVVLPAYNAEQTLEQTYNEIPFEIVDDVILVDDFSRNFRGDFGLDTLHVGEIVPCRRRCEKGERRKCENSNEF